MAVMVQAFENRAHCRAELSHVAGFILSQLLATKQISTCGLDRLHAATLAECDERCCSSVQAARTAALTGALYKTHRQPESTQRGKLNHASG